MLKTVKLMEEINEDFMNRETYCLCLAKFKTAKMSILFKTDIQFYSNSYQNIPRV